jgi:hypothetical protein
VAVLLLLWRYKVFYRRSSCCSYSSFIVVVKGLFWVFLLEIPHFKAEEIGTLELSYMSEQRLQNLGIPLGPRLRILEEIQNLR